MSDITDTKKKEKRDTSLNHYQICVSDNVFLSCNYRFFWATWGQQGQVMNTTLMYYHIFSFAKALQNENKKKKPFINIDVTKQHYQSFVVVFLASS